MSEMTLLNWLGWVSAGAAIVPALALAFTFAREALSSSFVIMDETGKVLGKISAEIAQQDPADLAALHQRIRRTEHVTVRSAA